MNFFRKKKAPTIPSEYGIALHYAKDCQFGMRHGDPETDFAYLDGGVRLVIYEFGNSQPFILGRTTRDWIKERFKLSDYETQTVMDVLNSRARKFLQEAERRRVAESQGLGGRSMADSLRKQWFG